MAATNTNVKKSFYFTTGQRRSVKLVYDGFYYVKFMENSRGIKWICATRSSTRCRARLRTNKAELEVLCGDHNHDVERSRGNLRLVRHKQQPDDSKPTK